MSPNFLQELAVYNANLIELLACAGRYVVIRGEEILGPFDALDQAGAAGRARHGAGPFLVKQIGAEATSAGQAG